MTPSNVFTDPDLTYLYREDPELLAIADTLVEAAQTQRSSHWVRPRSRRMLVALVAAVVVVAGAGSALAVTFHFFGGEHAVDFVPAPGQVPTIHDQQSVDGGIWSVTTFVNPEGQTCFGIRVGKGGEWQECINLRQLFARTPLLAQADTQRGTPSHDPGQWHDPGHFTDIAVWGIIDTSTAAKVELQLSNCQTLPLQPDSDGIFETVLDSKTLATGVIPLRVVAYDASGNLVGTRPLDIQESNLANQTPQPSCSG